MEMIILSYRIAKDWKIVTLFSSQVTAENNLYFTIANLLFIISMLTVLSKCIKTIGTKCDTLILNTNNSKREANS